LSVALSRGGLAVVVTLVVGGGLVGLTAAVGVDVAGMDAARLKALEGQVEAGSLAALTDVGDRWKRRRSRGARERAPGSLRRARRRCRGAHRRDDGRPRGALPAL